MKNFSYLVLGSLMSLLSACGGSVDGSAKGSWALQGISCGGTLGAGNTATNSSAADQSSFSSLVKNLHVDSGTLSFVSEPVLDSASNETSIETIFTVQQMANGILTANIEAVRYTVHTPQGDQTHEGVEGQDFSRADVSTLSYSVMGNTLILSGDITGTSVCPTGTQATLNYTRVN